METIFSKIVSGEIHAHKVAETSDFIAFMDISPLSRGHVLAIPKKATDYIFDIEDEDYIGLWMFAKIVVQGIKSAFPCERVGVAVVGLEVAHAHIHLIPINNVSDMDFSRPKLKLTSEDLEYDAKRIREALNKELGD